jgi:choline kinase
MGPCYRPAVSVTFDRSPTVPAVILAAGLGRRIASLTNGGPKALLELDGRTLLDRTIVALRRARFSEVVVVTGHAAERIRSSLGPRVAGMEIIERWNPDFDSANNIVSLLAAGDRIGAGFCLLNCDIVFHPSILEDVAGLEAGNWLVVDGDEPLGAEEMKVTLDDKGVVTRISKSLDPALAVGEYIGILRFDATGAALLQAAARRLVLEGGRDLYYEDAIDAAAADLAVRVAWTHGRPWTEIDDDDDYRRALRVAAELDAAPR